MSNTHLIAFTFIGPFPERGEERGLYLMIETINLQGLSQDHAGKFILLSSCVLTQLEYYAH